MPGKRKLESTVNTVKSTESGRAVSTPASQNSKSKTAKKSATSAKSAASDKPSTTPASHKKSATTGGVAAGVRDSDGSEPPSKRAKITKLAPPRPFPTVPTSVSASAPRSSHNDGKKKICITRKTPLGAYLSRCKNVLIQDGYKSLHLSAMGGAIPHLTLLATSLPDILPFGTEELKVEYFTGTVGVTDEVTPEDEEQDSYLRERSKSTLSVIFHIGKGDEPQHLTKANSAGRGKPGKRGPRKRGHAKANKETRERMEGVEGTEPKEGSDVRHVRIVEEPEQDEEDDNAMDSS